MGKQIDQYLSAGTKSILDYCTSGNVNPAEAEAISSAFADELMNNVGSLDKLKDPSRIALLSSVKFMSERIKQLCAKNDISYSECSEGLDLCGRMKAVNENLDNQGITLTGAPVLNIDRCVEQFRKKQEENLTINTIAEKGRRLEAVIRKAQLEASVQSCEEALYFLDDYDNDIESCKKRGIVLPTKEIINTAVSRKNISEIKKKAELGESLYQCIASTDDQISKAITGQATSPEQCQKVIRLCESQRNNIIKCNKQGLSYPSVDNSNLDNLKEQYKHYAKMLDLDARIAACKNERYNSSTLDLLNDLCREQESNITRCRQSRWALPNIQELSPGETASDANRQSQKYARRQLIKKKFLKFVLVSTLIIAGLAFGYFKYREGKIQVPFDSANVIGIDQEEIVNELKEAGFTNILVEEDTSGWAKSGLVTEVSIDGSTRYKKGAYRKPDVSVVISYSSNDRVDMTTAIDKWDTKKASDLVRVFRLWGFNHVTMTKTITRDAKENYIVSKFLINGDPFTGDSCHIPKTAEIVIEYYALKLKIGQSAADFEDKQYSDVVATLNEKGFTNIKLKRADDLILGWIDKEGAIKSITITGNSSFSENEELFFDDEIVIVVHTFSGKGCEDITEIDGE